MQGILTGRWFYCVTTVRNYHGFQTNDEIAYNYAASNPTMFNDPLGLKSAGPISGPYAEFWNQAFSYTSGYGASWSSHDGWTPFRSEQEAFYTGASLISWGRYDGWAGNYEEAAARFNATNTSQVEASAPGGFLTISGGYYRTATGAPTTINGKSGNFFVYDVSGKKRGVTAKTGEKYDWGRVGNALTAGGVAYYGLEKSINNSKYWVDAKGGIRSTELLEKGANGKYVRGVQGLRNSQAAAAKAASKYAVAGKVVGGIGMGVTVVQWRTGQISGTEASIDLIMGGIGFTGWGAPVSLFYFGGKFIYEYSTGDTLFEKPDGL